MLAKPPCRLALGLLLVAVLMVRAQPASSEKKALPPPPSAPSVEALKIPTDAVLVIVEQAADALRLVPKLVVLPVDKYQEMMDELTRLRGQARVDKPAAPSKGLLKGKVENNVLTFQAQFEFRTEKPNAAVLLGCAQAQASEVSLDDGRKPLLRRDPTEGYSVVVEKPGEHKLTLDLSLGLTPRPGGRAIELDLPRAAMTPVELELPVGSREPRLAGKPLSDQLIEFKNNSVKGTLAGPAERLDLAWVGPPIEGGGALTARGQIQVRLFERQTQVEAELHLQREGGRTAEWSVLLPVGAMVKLSSEDETKLAGIDKDEKPYGSYGTLFKIRLKEPVPSVRLLVTLTTPQPRPGTTSPVGPFILPGAARQEGTVLVSSAVPGLRLDFTRRAMVAPREIRPEEAKADPGLVAAFHYWNMPVIDKPAAATGPGSLALIDIFAEPVRGLLEARVNHSLRLVRDETGARRWRLQTRIEATPVRSGVEQVRVRLPAEFRYSANAGSVDSAVRSVEWDESPNLLTFHLAGPAPAKGYVLNLEGDYLASAPPTGQALLALPIPMDVGDSGGQVQVTVPDDLELYSNSESNPTLESSVREPQARAWTSARFPERIDLAWRPYRPETRVDSEADVTLTEREGHVRQTLRYTFRRPPQQLALRVSPAVTERLRIVRGGTLNSRQLLDPKVRFLDLPANGPSDSGARDSRWSVVVEYSFALSSTSNEPLQVPLIHPDGEARGQSKVRVWGTSGALPLPPGEPWEELNVEEVSGVDRLPALVVRSQRINAPLTLSRAASGNSLPVLADKVLVRVAISEGGGQSYRVGFSLVRLGMPYLDIVLPVPVASLALQVTLDGKKEVDWESVDENGARADTGRIARLRLAPDMIKRGSVVEVAYNLPQGRANTGIGYSAFSAPSLRDEAERVATRWLVTLPAGWIALSPEPGSGEEHAWERRGWFFAPRLTTTSADLEQWFGGPESTPAALDDANLVTCWRDRPGTLLIVHAPQLGWLLICSLGVIGLASTIVVIGRTGEGNEASLDRKPIFRTWIVPAILIAASGISVAGTAWPQVAYAVLYGCQPGIAVLLVLSVGIWVQKEQRRRRLASLPTFTRQRPTAPAPPSSAWVSPVRVPSEPSTVDVPKVNGTAARSSAHLPRLDAGPPTTALPTAVAQRGSSHSGTSNPGE